MLLSHVSLQLWLPDKGWSLAWAQRENAESSLLRSFALSWCTYLTNLHWVFDIQMLCHEKKSASAFKPFLEWPTAVFLIMEECKYVWGCVRKWVSLSVCVCVCVCVCVPFMAQSEISRPQCWNPSLSDSLSFWWIICHGIWEDTQAGSDAQHGKARPNLHSHSFTHSLTLLFLSHSLPLLSSSPSSLSLSPPYSHCLLSLRENQVDWSEGTRCQAL